MFLNRLIPLLVLSLFFMSCASREVAGGSGPANTETIGRELNGFIKDAYSDTKAVDVIYVTNRSMIGPKSECSDNVFGVTAGDKVQMGICRVNVPKKHRVGSFELAPTPRSDPHTYFRFLTNQNLESFDALKTTIQSKLPGDVLVFVHGFNVKFQDAVLRAAQIAYDVKFQGPVIVFSWPAGSTGFIDSTLIMRTYTANKAAAAATIPAFVDFIKFLSGLNANIHLLVHSMGHQVVLPALAKASEDINKKVFGEIILNAPDFPVDEFRDLAAKASKLANRVTLYCSYNDNAIAASEKYNSNRRMGGCERIDGVDVINVGEIDAPTMGISGLGHGYYASRPILGDLYQLLLRIDAEKRLFIRKSEPNSTEDYYLRP